MMRQKSGFRNQRLGFTLIELMMAVGIIAMMASTGAAIFSRTLRGSSEIYQSRLLDDRMRVIINGLSRFFLEGEVVSTTLLGVVKTRSDCPATGSTTGDSVVVEALMGLSLQLTSMLGNHLFEFCSNYSDKPRSVQ
jgi:prepilin-type N-terminal cleavage/methylation domain-containing protein